MYIRIQKWLKLLQAELIRTEQKITKVQVSFT